MSRPRRPSPTLRGALLLAAVLAAGACASSDGPENLGLETYLHNAQGYADGGHWSQALVEFRRALQVEADNRKALLGEATCLYWLGTGENSGAGEAILEAEAKMEALDPGDFGANGWKVRLTGAMVHARLAELWSRKAEAARAAQEKGNPVAEEEIRACDGARDRHEEAAREGFLAVLAEPEEPMAKDNLTALFHLASRGALRARSPADYREPLEHFRRFAELV
jgi:hypothetical protein